jgi:hypothetical protein
MPRPEPAIPSAYRVKDVVTLYQRPGLVVLKIINSKFISIQKPESERCDLGVANHRIEELEASPSLPNVDRRRLVRQERDGHAEGLCPAAFRLAASSWNSQNRSNAIRTALLAPPGAQRESRAIVDSSPPNREASCSWRDSASSARPHVFFIHDLDAFELQELLRVVRDSRNP